MKLLEFDCEIVHREHSLMGHVDALNRSPEPEPAGFIMNVNVGSEDWVFTMQLRDEELERIIGVLCLDIQFEQHKQLKTDFTLQNNRLYRRAKDGQRLVVPKAVLWRIAK